MYVNENYRSPYPCYSPNSVPAVATTAGATTTQTNALCAALSDNALYLIGLASLLRDMVGPQAIQNMLRQAQHDTIKILNP